MLEVCQLSSFYGPIQALREVSLEVGAGEAVAVLGPNGAGKSTLLHSISGLVSSRQGSIKYKGREIIGRSPHSIVRLGIVHVPEGRRIFTQMTVSENLMMGAFTRRDKRSVNEDLDFVYSLFPDLGQKNGQLGGELSGGQQQMLAIGRALMNWPKLLFLDEPSLGLSPILVKDIFTIIKNINQEGVTILLVEQNARMALKISDFGLILENGRFVMKGKSKELMEDKDVQEFYMGIHSEESAKGYQRWKRKKRWR